MSKRIVLLAALVFATLGGRPIADLFADPQQQITDPEWVCTFSLKGDKPLFDPIVHVHVLVHGRSEADAAIKAHSHLRAFIVAEDKIVFIEAAAKK